MSLDTIETNCPTCNARLRLPAAQAGKLGRCAKCQTVFTIPDQATSPPQQASFEGFVNNLQPAQPQGPQSPFGNVQPPLSQPPLEAGKNPYASGSFQPAAGPPPFGTHPYYDAPGPQQQRGGAMPIISLVSGIVSWSVCCCAPLSIPVALVAIVTGHIGAMSNVANRTLAVVGMVLGYLNLVTVVGIVVVSLLVPDVPPPAINNPQPVVNDQTSPVPEMEAALDKGTAEDFALGNDETSIVISQELAMILFEAQDEIFTPQEIERLGMVSLPVVYCRDVDTEQIAIFIKVPAFDQFTAEQQSTYAALAWRTAHDLAWTYLDEGVPLMVAITMGNQSYGSVQIGEIGATEEDVNHIHITSTNRQDVLDFYGLPEAVAVPVENVPAEETAPVAPLDVGPESPLPEVPTEAVPESGEEGSAKENTAEEATPPTESAADSAPADAP